MREEYQRWAEREAGLGERQQGDEQREPGDECAVALEDAVVDDPLEQQRASHDEQGVDDHEGEEPDDLLGVRAREGEHAARRTRRQTFAVLGRVLARHRVHHAHRTG